MLKRLKIVLLISIIVMVSLSSIVLADDDLPDIEGDMTENEVEEAVMVGYLAYIHNAVEKEDIKGLFDELQDKAGRKFVKYYSKTKYKNEKPIPNIMMSKMDESLSGDFRAYALMITNTTNQKINLNPYTTNITAITSSSSQLKAYNYYDPDVPKVLTKNMLKETTIYPGSHVVYTVIFPYTDKKLETFYIDPIIYEDGHREEIKIENLY